MIYKSDKYVKHSSKEYLCWKHDENSHEVCSLNVVITISKGSIVPIVMHGCHLKSFIAITYPIPYAKPFLVFPRPKIGTQFFLLL